MDERKRIQRQLLAAISMAIAVVACNEGRPASAGLDAADSAGIRVLRGRDESIRSLPPWSISAEPLARMRIPADGGVRFYRVSGVVRLANGKVVVASDADRRLSVFDSTGQAVSTSGGTGQGPGEYQSLQLLPQTDRDTLAAYDPLQHRLTLVAADGTPGPSVRIGGTPHGSPHPIYRFQDGSLLVWIAGIRPLPTQAGVVRDSARVLRVSPDGTLLADFGWHPANDRILRAAPTGGLTGGDPPMPRRLLLAATDSTVFVASTGPELEVRAYDSATGQLRRIVRIATETPRVTRAMRESIRRQMMQHATDAYSTREWTRNSADDVFPERLPALDTMLVTRSGALWLRTSHLPGDTDTEWTVLAANGQPIAHATLPAAFTPAEILADRILGVMSDTDGLESVVILGLVRDR